MRAPTELREHPSYMNMQRTKDLLRLRQEQTTDRIHCFRIFMQLVQKLGIMASKYETARIGFFSMTVFLLMMSQAECQLPQNIINEIRSHKADVQRIIDYILTGDGKHEAITRLAYITDTYGPRTTGSEALEAAIDYSLDELRQMGFDNVNSEDVVANKWVRNEESAAIIEPRQHKLEIMSLGSSVSGIIEAEVVVVKDFDELEAKYAEDNNVFAGKIVLYNEVWDGYSNTVRYRSTGASRAAKYGAVAALLRSVTQYSINSPHTGQQGYENGTTQIPVAAVTVEDAHQMARYYKRGVTIRVQLNMTCENLGEITTRNVIAELTGSEKPDELVVIGGHIDSWDVGFGVMDDGGGVIISWQVLSTLKALGLTPKRTIRTVFWSAEEIGLVGGEQYYNAHKEDEKDKMSIIMESDYGTFKPLGLGFTGAGLAKSYIEEIMQLLSPINATGVQDGGDSPDTGFWEEAGVPLGNLWNANDKYFFYHHSHGDSITMEDPDDLDLCAIVWTVVSYVIANLDEKLPRTGDYVGSAIKREAQPIYVGILLLLSFLVQRLIVQN